MGYSQIGDSCPAVFRYSISSEARFTAHQNVRSLTSSAIYPIRKQIEWIFRVWKSQLQVHYFGKNWRIERVLCQRYPHLIGILLCHRLTAGWLLQDKQEHSFSKCVKLFSIASSA